MIIFVFLGMLAGTVAFVLASIVLRAASSRPDNRLFAAMALLAGGATLSMAVGKGISSFETDNEALSLILEFSTAALWLPFAYAFPRGRKPPRVLWLAAGAMALIGMGLGFGGATASTWHGFAPWLLLFSYVVSLILLLAQIEKLEKSAHTALRLVALVLGLRWILGSALGQYGVLAWFEVPSIDFPQDALGVAQVLVLGWILFRFQLLDIRRGIRGAGVAWAAAFFLSVHVTLVLSMIPWLQASAGVHAVVVAIILPTLLAVWAVWTWRDNLKCFQGSIDPHRGVRREIMERVLAVTGYVVDPEAVLAMIRAAMIEVFPNAKIEFRRAGGLRTLQGISAVLPESVEAALRKEDATVVDASSLMNRQRIGDRSNEMHGSILLPVRRAGQLYGAFELDIAGPTEADDLLTASAMADHLAVKLENVTLSSSLGQAGRELDHIKTFLEDMIESLPVGIVGISGPDLQVRLWNPFETRRSGLDASEVLGKNYLDDVAPRHVHSVIAEAIRRRPKEILSFPSVGWTDQHQQSVDITVAPLRARGGSEGGYVLILVDTTERNALHRELEETRRLAALGEFAAAIAHDIRTPLSSIRMSVQILRSKVVLPPEDMEYFDLTLEAIGRLGRDVEELLDFTKPVFLRVETVFLREVAEDAVAAVTSGMPRPVSIDLKVPEDLAVPVDETQVRRMLTNLLQNAVEASESGGRVLLEATTEGEEVRIVVQDEGRGIVSEDLERIWEPFYTTRTDGTGLGLALVRKTVTAHGGRAIVESCPGQGTRFVVMLPSRRATEVMVPIDECKRSGQEVA